MNQRPVMRLAGENSPQRGDIDIDRLTRDELIDLNRRIVERLRMIEQLEAHQAMLEFRVGQRVRFRSRDRRIIRGTLTRYNRKTVTLITPAGEQWNVSPGLLERDE